MGEGLQLPEITPTEAGTPETVSGNGLEENTGDSGSAGEAAAGSSTGEDTAGSNTGEDAAGSSTGEDAGDSPTSDADILAALDAVTAQLEESNGGDYDALASSVRTLAETISLQASSDSSGSSVPVGGYESWDYGITVTYEVYPYGAGYWMSATESFATAEEFAARYGELCSLVGDSIDGFYITSVVDDNGVTVYELSGGEEEDTEDMEDAEAEAADTAAFREEVLSSLSAIQESLQSISMNDLDSREDSLAMLGQYLALAEEGRELQYYNLASNICIGFALLLTLGYTIAHGFFQRMKAG